MTTTRSQARKEAVLNNKMSTERRKTDIRPDDTLNQLTTSLINTHLMLKTSQCVNEHIISRPKLEINYYLSNCTSLENTAKMLETLTYRSETNNLSKYEKQFYNTLINEIYKKLFDYIDRNMSPTFDEINSMLLVCRILLNYKMKNEISEFILNCPDKFLLTYVNNSERSPLAFSQLNDLGLENICRFLLPYVHYTKLSVWNERKNAHIRGKILFECNF